jgi:hypothetical protein
MTWLTVMEYLCHKWLRICSSCRKHFPFLSSFTAYRGFVTRLKQRVPLVEQELLTLPEYLNSSSVFSGVRVARSLVVCVCFVDRFLSFCPFSFWPLCCLFFFDIQILITPLVSSDYSWPRMLKSFLIPPLFLKCLYQARKVSGHIFVC